MQEKVDKILSVTNKFIFWITPRFYFCPDVTMIRWLNFEFLLPNKDKK